MRNLIVAGCVVVTTLLLHVTADVLSTLPLELSKESPAIVSDTDTFSATILRPLSDEPTDMAAEDSGPSKDVASSLSSSVEDRPPTAPSISEDASGTSSLASAVLRANPDDSEAGYSQRDVVVIAVCVSLLSLIVVVLSVAMTFLIRRRLRRKAYLRVKHASQTELAVHYVQNTPASAAARDLVMGQLFESLASMEADGPNDFQIAYSSDDQCLSPTESIGDEMVSGKNRMYSRSMPSLKNLNAHEEALNCHFSFVPSEVTAGGKRKGRSRSFTEKTISGVGVVEAARGKGALRSHSEKSKNRLGVVALLTPGKRFEKKKEKTANRRSTPSFSRFAKFNILRASASKQKAGSVKEHANGGTNGRTIEVEEQTTPNQQIQITVESDTTSTITAADNSSDLARINCYSASLSDFEMPNVSPIMHEMTPMLAALHMNGSALRNCESIEQDITTTDNDIRIFRDVPRSNHRLSSSAEKAASLEQVVGEYFRNKAAAGAGKASLSAGQIKTSQTSRSVNDLDTMRTTVV